MTTTHLYRSLSIKERLSEDNNYINKKYVDLDSAKDFWNQILEGDNPTHVNQILSKYYGTDTKFLEHHYELKSESTFSIQQEWFNHLLKEFNTHINMKYIEDKEFEEMDLMSFPFYEFFRPFFEEFYFDIFHNRLKHLNNQLTITFKNDIIKYFLDMLYSISHKTLILEINSFRLMGKLNGKTPAERYESFYCILKNDKNYKEELYKEYPVLFRLIATKIVNLKQYLVELLTYFEKDKHLLVDEYGISPKARLLHLHLGGGDSHKKGKTVTTLEFDDGKKIVYKPRSLSIDIEFQKFLEWINFKSSYESKLKITKILDKNNYGWSEFIDYNTCNSKEEVSSFYYQLGQLLAVLHVMNATDFHYENIISHGKHPVLIDLESLFHHTLSPNHSDTKSGVINKSLRLINDSVLSTGLIPNRAIQKDNPFDISGIGNTQRENKLPFKMEVVTGHHTDEVRIEKTTGVLVPGLNNPKLEDEELNIIDYLQDIENGFTDTYLIFMNNKKELIEKVQLFEGKEIRKLFRDTMKYAKLLQLSYHPDFLRNQLDREFLLNRLRVEDNETMERIVDFEIEDMLIGDVPYFTSTPEGKSIYSANGDELEGFYYKDGLSLSLEKISRLSNEDLNHQLNIISATISAVYQNSDVKLLKFNQNKDKDVKLSQVTKYAEEIADILLKNAITHKSEDGNELCWMSMVTKSGNEDVWVYSVTGPGLYDGNPGIALYFSYLWKVTCNSKYKDAAYDTINPIRKIIPDLIEPENINLGAYLGLSGIVYSLHHLGNVFQDKELEEEALKLAKLFTKYTHQDRLYDLIGGSAGALMVIMNLYEQYKEEWMIEQADELVNHITQNAVPQRQGVAWPPENKEQNPYIGFSHGNAGIIAALSRYNKHRGSNLVEEVIEKAALYENSFFSEKEKNWFSTHLDKYALAWCHGAPGILLSRCLLKENGIDFENLNRDIEAAYDSSIASSIGKNYSFCHGDLGLVDILMNVEEKIYQNHTIELEELKKRIINNMFSDKQIVADINSVGLLNGIASIGYGLLRLNNSKKVPSVLGLEGPTN